MRKAFLRLVFSTPERVWIAVALGLRLAFALKVGDRFHQIDEVGFDAPAWLLATTGSFRVDGQTLVVPPVPNAFFAFFYWLFGRHMLYPRLAQAAVSAGTAWVLGRMTGTLTGSCRAGRLALVTAAVYPFFIYYSGMLLSESLYIAASTLGLWWLCQSLQERGACRWRAPASGLALALAALCRAEGAPIAALIWLGAMLPCLMGRWPWRTWLTAVLMWVMPLLAWSGRNQAAVGSFALDNHGGMAMLHGNLLFDLNEIDTAMAQAELEQIPFYRESLHLSPPLRDRIYIRESLRFIRANPGKVLRQWAEKFVKVWYNESTWIANTLLFWAVTRHSRWRKSGRCCPAQR